MTTLPTNPNLLHLIKLLSDSAQLTPPDIATALIASSINPTDVASYVRFDDNNYTRNLVYECAQYQILLLCWRSGQGSPIHAHGSSACGLSVVSGIASESAFATATADSEKLSGRQLLPGDVVANDADYVHRVSNEASEPLITLHVYAPPLVQVPYNK